VLSFVIPRYWLALALAGTGVTSASAEAIHLKSGDVIYADSVKESANKVEYAIGDDTYAIPKSRVRSVLPPRPKASTRFPHTHPILRWPERARYSTESFIKAMWTASPWKR
jgi:hypothetical protein